MPALSFAGGNVPVPTPRPEALRASAGEWFDKALEAFAHAAELMASGAIEHAVSEMAHAERCSARARAYLAEAEA